MKAILRSAVATLAIAISPAFAADFAVPMEEPPVLAPAAPFSWSGVYIGVHGGAALRENSSWDDCGRFTNITPEGGGAPLFDSAEDIVDVPGDGFGGFNPPGPGEDFPEGCGTVEWSDTDPATNNEVEAFNLDGDYVAFEGDDGDGEDWNFLGGGQIGINQQYGRLVLGLEGDIAGVFSDDDDDGESLNFAYFHEYDGFCIANCLQSQEGIGEVSVENSLDWLATFRGRVGGAFGSEGRFLLYGTGGLAVAGVENSISGSWDDGAVLVGPSGGSPDSVDWCDDAGECTYSSDDDDEDDFKVGFAVGGGGEYAFTNNLSFGLQYLFVHFDDDSTSSITFHGDDGRSFDVEADSSLGDLHILTARLNWRFGSVTP
jgi:outer membrane immunogenic protein